MTYVDGFVVAVPTANREIYKKHEGHVVSHGGQTQG
jgi:uncharacterized protein YbaA (DUF1428 family)